MNGALKAIITTMLSKRYIGGKHTPEERLLNSKTRLLQKEEYRDFERGYKEMINMQMILRIQKRTGKGSDWHISLNPRRLKEVYEMIE